jgi:hypothetical protein
LVYLMPDRNEGHPNVEIWSLQQAASWIQSRTAAQPQAFPAIAAKSLEELHNALKAGQISGSGCVDGGERRTISAVEWHDYSLKLHYKTFGGAHFVGSLGTPVIDVLSIRSFPAAALKYHGYPSGIRIASSQSDGEAGYHRVITDVQLPCRQILQRWPADGDDPTEPELQSSTNSRRRQRTRPARERARQALDDIYPDGIPDQKSEPNGVLCGKVAQWLELKGLRPVSDETISRAAGRRNK